MKKRKSAIRRIVVVFVVITAMAVRCLPTQAEATITINYADPQGSHAFKIGESYKLKGSEYVDSASQQKIADITKDSITLQNQHVIAFGSTALWTDPTERNPDNWDWDSLDAKIDTMRLASGAGGADIVITLGMAPAWMTTHQAKTSPSYPAYADWTDYPGASSGNPNSKYTANPAANDDSITLDTIDASVDPWFEDDFAFMAAAVAERYPDVKTFQVWNEMKGYYLSGPNRWDYEQYTSLYNKVYSAVKAARPDAKLGGPYVVMSSWSSSGAASHPATNPACQGSWGIFDQRDIDVIDYWLQHKTGADYILIDGSTTNRDTNPGFQEFQTKERTDDLRACLDTVITAAPDQLLPIGIAEYYPKASSGSFTQQHAAAIIANALGDTIINKYNYVLLWDLMADSCDPLDSAGLIALSTSVNNEDCSNSAQQGQPSALAPVLKGIKETFGSNATLYAPQFDTTKVGVFANSEGTMLINKQNSSESAIINGCDPITLSAYEVKFVDPDDCIAPSAPPNAASEVHGMTVTLSWDASTDPTSVVAGYRVYRNGSFIQSLAPNQRSISDTYNGSEPIDLLYEIEAVDSFSNLSARTALANITLTPEQNQGPDDTDDDDTNNSATPSNSSVDENFTTTMTSNPNSKQAPGAPQTGIRLPKQQTLVGSAVIGIPLLTLTAYMVCKYQR
ncbi:MAG: hypothetical protein U0520_02195 [Candidatus Saccharimonadales bacterium]